MGCFHLHLCHYARWESRANWPELGPVSGRFEGELWLIIALLLPFRGSFSGLSAVL
jgi:hypothetical protein